MKNNITFNAKMVVYYYTVIDRYNNIHKFVCPELFSREQFRDLKDYILGVEFGKRFPEKPLVRNTGDDCYEVMIAGNFEFEVLEVAADPNLYKDVVAKNRFPYQWLKGILTDLLVPKDEIVISSWDEFIKGCKLLNEQLDKEEYI